MVLIIDDIAFWVIVAIASAAFTGLQISASMKGNHKGSRHITHTATPIPTTTPIPCLSSMDLDHHILHQNTGFEASDWASALSCSPMAKVYLTSMTVINQETLPTDLELGNMIQINEGLALNVVKPDSPEQGHTFRMTEDDFKLHDGKKQLLSLGTVTELQQPKVKINASLETAQDVRYLGEAYQEIILEGKVNVTYKRECGERRLFQEQREAIVQVGIKFSCSMCNCRKDFNLLSQKFSYKGKYYDNEGGKPFKMQCRDFEYLQSIQSTFVREVDEQAFSFGCKKGLVGTDCEWTIGTSGNIDHQCQNQSLLAGVQRTEIDKKKQFGGSGAAR